MLAPPLAEKKAANVLIKPTFKFVSLFGLSIDPSTRTSSLAGLRILTNVVVEDNLNVLAGAGTGIVVINETTVIKLQPALEVQYFLFGLEYLSFNAGVGLDLVMGSGENSVQTSGAVLGGFHYWF